MRAKRRTPAALSHRKESEDRPERSFTNQNVIATHAGTSNSPLPTARKTASKNI